MADELGYFLVGYWKRPSKKDETLLLNPFDLRGVSLVGIFQATDRLHACEQAAEQYGKGEYFTLPIKITTVGYKAT